MNTLRCFMMGGTLALLAVLCCSANAADKPASTVTLDIKAQPLDDALNTFGEQSGLQVVFLSRIGKGLTAPRLSGSYTPDKALEQLLKNTALRFEFINERTVAISALQQHVSGEPQALNTADRPADPALRLARAQGDTEIRAADEPVRSGRTAATAEDVALKGIPEILVKGARTSNTDIRRTEDDVQPYVVFDAEEIGRSMAPDLDTFLRTRLPMNQSRRDESRHMASSRGGQSSIDLRGLGADQTLVLVNGRRMPSVAGQSDLWQPDINGIPLSAVERIEILPSTAGGIYGGGATGGVVNIILKRNYSNMELTARYDGSFAGGGAERRLDATAGWTLEGGRTSVMLMGSYRGGNPLYVGDRDFTARALALQEKNNHAAFRGLRDPVHGYTTNIRSVSGNDLVLEADLRSLNANIAHVPVGYAGPASDNGAALLGTADQYNLMLAEDPLGNQYSLASTPTVRSLQISVRREFTDRLEVFADASRYDNRSERMGSISVSNEVVVTLPVGPNNPFTEAVELSVPLAGYGSGALRSPSRSLSDRLSSGVIVRLPREWVAQGEYNWSESEHMYNYSRDAVLADFGAALIDGRLNPLSDVNAYPIDFSAFYPGEDSERVSSSFPTEQQIATLRVSGPLLALPGGPLRLAALLERQEQYTGDRILATYPSGAGTPTFLYYPQVGSKIDSGYVELNAPLVSSANARPGLLSLDLLATYRHDATATRTRTRDMTYISVPSADGPIPEVPFQTSKVTGNQYTLGFRYTPVESLALRVSYGEGILPPVPNQLAANDFGPALLAIFRYFDPKRGDERISPDTVEEFTTQGFLGLYPELSRSWSGGAIFTPASLPGFRLSVDYTRIEKTNEIGSLSSQGLIDLGDDFPDRIVRNPLTPADEALGFTGGTIRALYLGNVNIAHSLMEAFDIQADYTWETRLGSFSANLIATVQPRLSQQPTVDSEVIESVGYSNGPMKWRGNAGLRFSRGALDLGWNMQYYETSRLYTSTSSESFRATVVLNQGSEQIPTQTYHDVYGRYSFGSVSGLAGGLLENSELQISVQNVLNTSPPILASTSSILYGGYATEGDPRLRRYSIAFTKRFGR